MTDIARKMAGTLLAFLDLTAILCQVAAPVLLGTSLLGSAAPTAYDFNRFAESYLMWWWTLSWLVLLTAANELSVTFCRNTLHVNRNLRWSWHGVCMAQVALMYWRVHGHAAFFRELGVLGAATSVLLLCSFLRPRAPRPALAKACVQDAPRAAALPAGADALRYRAVRPRFSFADVVGMRDTKARLVEAGRAIVLRRTQGQAPRNGVLLSGKPGNGKTFLAEALAGELQLPFLSISYGDLASSYINNTTEHVTQVFRDAARQAPCVLLIDEVDSLLMERNTRSSYEESAKTANAMLTELVNIRATGVVVVAATNFIDRLDAAAVREGRFDFKIEIPAPDAEARRHLIQRKCVSPISPDTVETAVRRWEGFSVARIAAVMEEASRTARGKTITFDILKRALRTVQGRQGSLPEDTPTLAQLVLSEAMASRLRSLAQRMDRIVEVEAMGGSVPRGLLFFGPPGTGKTVTARALAKTAHWAFLSVSGLDLMTDPARIDALVAEAGDLRPCIVFIDEADDVLRDRRYSGASASITNKLLAAIDGASGRAPDILYIAATNHPDAMDPAALRGGRFTEKIAFGLPDEATVARFLRQWKTDTKATLARDFSLKSAARKLAGQPLANVKEILQMAVNLAIGRSDLTAGSAPVTSRDLDQAIMAVLGAADDVLARDY